MHVNTRDMHVNTHVTCMLIHKSVNTRVSHTSASPAAICDRVRNRGFRAEKREKHTGGEAKKNTQGTQHRYTRERARARTDSHTHRKTHAHAHAHERTRTHTHTGMRRTETRRYINSSDEEKISQRQTRANETQTDTRQQKHKNRLPHTPQNNAESRKKKNSGDIFAILIQLEHICDTKHHLER
jgi:hypothetical protein